MEAPIKYLEIKKKAPNFKETEIDETPSFDPAVKGSVGYKGCVAIALYNSKEGALFHCSQFPAYLEKNFMEYVEKLSKKKNISNLKAKIISVNGLWAREERKTLEKVLNKLKIPFILYITNSKKPRSIIFYTQTGDLKMFFSNRRTKKI